MWAVAAIRSDLRVVYEGIIGFVMGWYLRQRENASQHGGAASWGSVWSQRLTLLGARMLQELVGLWFVT